jgi:hypothetical protein
MALTVPLVTHVSSLGVLLGCAWAFEAISIARITTIPQKAIRMVCFPSFIITTERLFVLKNFIVKNYCYQEI